MRRVPVRGALTKRLQQLSPCGSGTDICAPFPGGDSAAATAAGNLPQSSKHAGLRSQEALSVQVCINQTKSFSLPV